MDVKRRGRFVRWIKCRWRGSGFEVECLQVS
jgi:hypothetical protein